jgi:hypothetical protein
MAKILFNITAILFEVSKLTFIMLPFTEDGPNSLRNARVGSAFFDTTQRKHNSRLNIYYVA